MAKMIVGVGSAVRDITIAQASEAFRLRCQAQGLSAGTLVWYRENLKRWTRFLESSGVTLARCAALNLAKGTLAWYERLMADLEKFLSARGVESLAAVEAAVLREYLADLRHRGQGSETVFRTYGAVRSAFRFWHREGVLAVNPMALVERPRRERVLIRPMNPDQAARLLEQPSVSSLEGLRDRALMMLLLDSGLRISEALSLEAERIDWLNCTMTVMGKGRKERSVPFSSRTCSALLEYARRRGQGRVLAGQFFLGPRGRPLDRSNVRKAIVAYGRRACIEGVRVSPHTLRHTFAVLYIRNGGDSFSLQEILGHSTLEMTRRYVHLARRDVAEQHKKFSPMERIAGGWKQEKAPKLATLERYASERSKLDSPQSMHPGT